MNEIMLKGGESKSSLTPELPIFVQRKVLNVELLPDWKEVLMDLPVGVGVKGGIARKILKVISGLNHSHPDFASEMNGVGDIDILVAVSKVTPDVRLNIRKHFSGTSLGGMEIMPKDIEVADNMASYFRCRDVTMNEVLAFRENEHIMLYYTEAAQRDIASGTIAPSVHCLKTSFGKIWHYDHLGNMIVAPKNFDRCIIRWVKGHGLHYQIGHETWAYYQERGLTLKSLYRIFRNFVTDDEKFFVCHRHLTGLGLIEQHSDPNQLWGSCLFEVNSALSKHGRRITFEEPTAEQIEQWICRKEAEFKGWDIDRQTKISIGLKVEPDIEAPVYLPDGIENFQAYFT